jgi:ferric iron reductase protein FhuF
VRGVKGSPYGLRFLTLEEAFAGDASPEVTHCTAITDTLFRRRSEERFEPGPDSPRLRIRRSWVWVDYVAILMGRAVLRLLLEGVAEDVSASNTVVELGEQGFEGFMVREDRGELVGPDDPSLVYKWAIDDHASAVMRATTASSKVGARNLWGSVVAHIVRTSIQTCDRLGLEVPVDRLDAILRGRPELAGKGDFVWLDAEHGPRLAGFHRSTCCLWFRADPGERCRDCVLATREEFVASLSAEPMAESESA